MRVAVAVAASMALGVAVLAAAAPASAAPPGGGTADVTPPTGGPAQGSITNVAASATWGISNGKPFFHVTKGKLVGTYKPKAPSTGGITPAYSGGGATCTETISNVSFSTVWPGVFHWQTEQICSGTYGWQNMHTQMWRSSWSGPRGYGGWATSTLTTNYYTHWYWGINCNLNGGLYTYYPVMYGYASGIGYGPTIRSGNSLRKYCGTSPP